MAKIYLSSTLADLKAERQAATDWLLAAGHQPVHSYRPDSEAVGVSCLDDIAGCDAYVLILGHRYGHVPADDNPSQRSITHLEFQRAGELGLPRVALLRTSVPDARLSDLTDPQRAAQVMAFRLEVERALRAAEFGDMQGLIQGLSTGVQGALARGQGASPSPSPRPPRPSPSPPAPQPDRNGNGNGNGSWWTTLPGLLTGLAGLVAAVAGLVGVLQGRAGDPSPAAATATAQAATHAAAVTPPVVLPAPGAPARAIALDGSRELAFNQPAPVTYSVLQVRTEALRPGVVALRLQVRAHNRDRYDLVFWDRSFRLLVDGIPQEPAAPLSELVPSMSAKEGEVLFEVPTGAKTLGLQILAGDQVLAVAPMHWQPG